MYFYKFTIDKKLLIVSLLFFTVIVFTVYRLKVPLSDFYPHQQSKLITPQSFKSIEFWAYTDCSFWKFKVIANSDITNRHQRRKYEGKKE